MHTLSFKTIAHAQRIPRRTTIVGLLAVSLLWAQPHAATAQAPRDQQITAENVITAIDRGVETGKLIRRSEYIFEHFPEFHEYLEAYPHRTMPGVQSFLYWSKEKFGFKPVISITHVAIYVPAGPSRTAALMASRQIYASHYFDASLSLTALVPAPGTSPAAYLIYLNRTRAPIPGGVFANFARPIIRTRTRGGLERQLQMTKDRLEAGFRGAAQVQ